METALQISWAELAGFALILGIPLWLNHALQLKLAKETAIAVVRMSFQLILVGLYLQFLFELNSAWLNLAWLMVMLLVGSTAILDKAKLPTRALFAPVFLGLFVGALPVLGLILLGLLQPSPWYHAQYLIPLAGMLLGNSLSGNIVALQRLFDSFKDKQSQYEGALCLGATPRQAAFPFIQQAIRQSLAPILASMTTTGLVTLPGMMTGQILRGTHPMLAIQYQLMIMLAIFVTLALSVTLCLLLIVRLNISDSGRLLVELSR